MAISTQVTVEEYLRTSHDPDCEYVDGEVLDRNVGTKKHSKVQRNLLAFFLRHQGEFGVFALQEWRMRTNERRYRIPDLLVIAGAEPDEEILSTPPLICVEILSPEDCMARMQKKIHEYLTFGVRYVWVLVPETREAFVYTLDGIEKAAGALRTANPPIEIPLSQVFD